MPDDIKRPLYTPKPLANPRQNSNAGPCRSTYSPENAYQFKEIFDQMIETGSSVVIESKVCGYKPNTLYIKTNDALKWMLENDVNKDKYALLRARITIARVNDGVHLRFKNSLNTLQSTIMDSRALTWKDDFDKWFETAQEGEMFERIGVIITDQQKSYIVNVMAGVGVTSEVEITSTSVKVMR